MGRNPGAQPTLFETDPTFERTIDHGVQNYVGKKKLRGDSLRYLTRSLLIDSKANVWTSTPWQLERYNHQKKRFEVKAQLPLATHGINSLMDSKGIIWLGSYNLVARFDTTKNSYTSFRVPGSVNSLMDDGRNLWVGSTGGLTRYNFETNQRSFFYNDANNPESISSNIVYQVMIDSDKYIWVGTSGGLNRIVKGTENQVPKFQRWGSAHSNLPNDDVYSIVEDHAGTLWLACGNAISHFFPKENLFRNYNRGKGLSGANFKGLLLLSGKGLRTASGEIFFGSSDGLIKFHPDSLRDNLQIPTIRITGFSISNQDLPVKGSDADTLASIAPLEKSISYLDKISLPYNQNDFSIEFSGLSFVDSEYNEFKYKLEPYENLWLETNAANRVARYTNISPGTYTFRVIGSNYDGTWNTEGTTLTIIIAPPWWQTWWAFTFYLIAFVFGVFYWRRFENKRIALKRRTEHLLELDNLKSRFFANISHEFRTPLTLILGPLKEMYSGTFMGDSKPTFSVMIRNGERLLRLINQLLDLSKLEAGKMSLDVSTIDMVSHCRQVAAFYESMAERKQIRYFFDAESPELIVSVDVSKIDDVIHNLLGNAFKFTNRGGQVIIAVKKFEKQWAVIRVSDTGIGIPEAEVNKVFDRFNNVDRQERNFEGSGLGLALAKEFVNLHKGKIHLESKLGKGTTLSVYLPLLQESQATADGRVSSAREHRVDPTGVTTETNRENIIGASKTLETDRPIVIVIEDNDDMRSYIKVILTPTYQILDSASAKDGLKLIDEVMPDLIVSDVMMPEMDGYKLCEIVKKKELTSHIPVILITAKADDNSRLAGLEIGADDYLFKPFDAQELRAIVRNRIAARNKMKEIFSREVTLEPRQITVTSFDERFIQKVLAVIEQHLANEHFSIEQLSQEVGYSSMHLYRKIKSLTGQTPSQFLRTIRLKRAAQLLSQKSDNVTQIAYSVGFNSLSYFNKCFKEQFGITPGKFAEESLPEN